MASVHETTYDTHEYDLLIRRREIFLFGREDYVRTDLEDQEPGVEYSMANRCIRNLRLLSHTKSPILMHLKTNGGDWMEGMAIYQAIKTSHSFVTMINYTHARSMSSIILQAADWRVMLPYSHFMFHDGTMGFDGTVKQALTEIEQMKIACDQMMHIYLEKAVGAPFWKGKSRSQIRKWMKDQMARKEEVYVDAETTVAMGFADEVLSDYDVERLRADKG